ncbi:unnamed protein product [Caenorhabditis sp. 36 PRJEB53466]|nr:unnamed protein product [Caenorhabditis sp. 36 PRJEB53466]
MLLQQPHVIFNCLGALLPTKDLVRLTMTHPSLKKFFDENEHIWKNLMSENLWTERRFFRFQDDVKFLLNNSPKTHSRTISINQENLRYLTYSNDGTMTAIFANGCHLWIFRDNIELLHVYLSKKRMWSKVLTVSFSPDDKHLLVTGIVNPLFGGSNTRETLIYRIGEERVSLKSWVILEHQMLAAWYDNSNIIYMNNEGNPDMMRLFISSIDNSADIMVYPILTFNKRITKIMVAQHVSPRTRKIVQIADQATMEGKTLTEKLFEIGAASGVDISNMSELKTILDQNDECMPCYRLHAHHDAVTSSECTCECHHNTDKLLIFHGNDDKVHAKVITEKMLENAKEAWRCRGENEHPDHIRLFFPLFACTDFDSIDYTFNIEWSLNSNSACFSPDHRYLYITGTRQQQVQNRFTEIKPTCVDLETMTIRKIPDFSAVAWVAFSYDVRITANNDFVALFSNNSVIIWSAFHQGKPVDILALDGMISSVSLHPMENSLFVTNERLLYKLQSPEIVRNLSR